MLITPIQFHQTTAVVSSIPEHSNCYKQGYIVHPNQTAIFNVTSCELSLAKFQRLKPPKRFRAQRIRHSLQLLNNHQSMRNFTVTALVSKVKLEISLLSLILAILAIISFSSKRQIHAVSSVSPVN